MKQIGMVVLVAVMAAILPLQVSADPVQVGVVPAVAREAPVQAEPGAVQAPPRAPQERAPVISVSFTGPSFDVIRRAFKLEADERGQPVELKDWGGKYLVSFRFETKEANFQIAASKLGIGRYIRGSIDGQTTRTMVAEIKTGQEFLGSEQVSASGLKTSLVLGVYSGSVGFSASSYRGWLGQSLDGQCIRKMVPILLDRLLALETEAQAKSQSEAVRMAADPVTKERGQFRYTLMSVNNDIKPVAVMVEGELDYNQTVAVYRKGQRLGTIMACYFNPEHTRVSIAGDTGLLKNPKGLTLVPE